MKKYVEKFLERRSEKRALYESVITQNPLLIFLTHSYWLAVAASLYLAVTDLQSESIPVIFRMITAVIFPFIFVLQKSRETYFSYLYVFQIVWVALYITFSQCILHIVYRSDNFIERIEEFFIRYIINAVIFAFKASIVVVVIIPLGSIVRSLFQIGIIRNLVMLILSIFTPFLHYAITLIGIYSFLLLVDCFRGGMSLNGKPQLPEEQRLSEAMKMTCQKIYIKVTEMARTKDGKQN